MVKEVHLNVYFKTKSDDEPKKEEIKLKINEILETWCERTCPQHKEQDNHLFIGDRKTCFSISFYCQSYHDFPSNEKNIKLGTCLQKLSQEIEKNTGRKTRSINF